MGVPAYAAQVTLAWNRNTEPDIVGYRIYYGTGTRAYNWFIDVGNVTQYTITDLANGSTYYLAATAYNSSNIESAYSAEVIYTGCTYSISPTTASIAEQGGTGTLQVMTQTGCSWTARSGASWLTITSGNAGTGNGTVTYSATSNTDVSARNATSTIAGNTFTVTQAGSSPASTALGTETKVILGASLSADVTNRGTIYYHDGVDRVGRTNTTVTRAVNLWDISNIDPSWKISSVEVRFYCENKISSTGALSLVRYGSSHGEDDPRSDSGSVMFSKITGTQYASLPEPSSNAWTGWIKLGSTAVSDIIWSRKNGKSVWSLGLKASNTVELSTTARSVEFSEDNEKANAELRITYSQSLPSKSYSINASAGTGGYISPSGTVTLPQGANKTFSITPATGYRISNVSVDGVSVGAVKTYTFSNIDRNHTIYAAFQRVLRYW